ncbi:hypothetical protein lerEdw1_010827 [Lerista edwardsae]|nr:hypothetical protein lerEdw1_010827 [Lerista edwardsae]
MSVLAALSVPGAVSSPSSELHLRFSAWVNLCRAGAEAVSVETLGLPARRPEEPASVSKWRLCSLHIPQAWCSGAALKGKEQAVAGGERGQGQPRLGAVVLSVVLTRNPGTRECGPHGWERGRVILRQVCVSAWSAQWSPRSPSSRGPGRQGDSRARSQATSLSLPTAPPKEPVLMCRSNNYPNGFYCSWHLPSPTHIPDTFNITVTHDSKDIGCEKDVPPKNRCYIRYFHLFSSKKYKVTLTVTNALGSSSTSTSFDEFAIVKPDPPENVVAKPIPNNARRLLVTWQNPSSWPDPESFPLKFFLRYRPLIIDQWQHVELSDGTSHVITDAYAGKEYIIQVAAKDNDIGTWSDWSVAVHATPWTEEPKHLTTEAQGADTTTATTTAFVVPPTTKIYDPEERSGNGATALSRVGVLVSVAFSIHFI